LCFAPRLRDIELVMHDRLTLVSTGHALARVALMALTACGGGGEPAATSPSAPAAIPAPPTPTAAVQVELTHDVVCPWCRIGHTRLVRAIAAYGKPVEVRYRPFLLEPDMPPEGADLRARLAAKYGAERVESMFARVTQAGASDGLRFDFAAVRRSPSSVLAHVLIEAAPIPSKHTLLQAIQDAYFERGEDIGDTAVLERLWVGVGLSADAARVALADVAARGRVRAEAEAAARAGVRGVPSFTIGGTVIGGAQPQATLEAALEAAGRPR